MKLIEPTEMTSTTATRYKTEKSGLTVSTILTSIEAVNQTKYETRSTIRELVGTPAHIQCVSIARHPTDVRWLGSSDLIPNGAGLDHLPRTVRQDNESR